MQDLVALVFAREMMMGMGNLRNKLPSQKDMPELGTDFSFVLALHMEEPRKRIERQALLWPPRLPAT